MMAFPFKRAIVTGGAGFIGSHIVEELLKDGLEVVSIDNYVAGVKENLEPFHSYPGFLEVNCDIVDYKELEPYFDGVDIVFHEAASKMTVCLEDPRRDLAVNAEGTFNVLELSRKCGVRKIIHASTGSVYGSAHYYPTDEKHFLNPTFYYGVSKLAGEKYARVFSELYDMDVTILRYYHVYGPRQESSDVGGVVSIFARRALHDEPIIIFGDGTQMRSFTYVKDVVNINKLVAVKEETKGEAFNCASGAKVTIHELAEKVLAYYGKEHLDIKFRDWKLGDIKRFDVDNSKLRSLGFEFRTSFDQGLAQTLEWSRRYFGK
jgi:nucleoside-diphosphate-sugar epimerase